MNGLKTLPLSHENKIGFVKNAANYSVERYNLFYKVPAVSFSFEFRKTHSKAHSKPILEKVILLRHIAAFVK